MAAVTLSEEALLKRLDALESDLKRLAAITAAYTSELQKRDSRIAELESALHDEKLKNANLSSSLREWQARLGSLLR